MYLMDGTSGNEILHSAGGTRFILIQFWELKTQYLQLNERPTRSAGVEDTISSSLSKKLKIQPGFRIAIVNSPEGYLDALMLLPEGAVIISETEDQSDIVRFL